MKTNTAASPVMDSHPQECFSADLSVFQAHLPLHEISSSCEAFGWFGLNAGDTLEALEIMGKSLEYKNPAGW